MGIKDDFHQKSILICVDELCGRNPDNVSIHLLTSHMSAYVLLNLLKELRKMIRDEALPKNLLLFLQ